MRASRVTTAVVAAGLGVLGSLVATPATAGLPPAAAPFARISEIGIGDTVEQPSIARFGSTYEVVWVHVTGTTTKTYGINARILSASGQAVGGVISVVSGWTSIRDYPTILAAGGKRVIAFNGYRATKGPGDYNSPAEYYFTSTDGTHWTLGTGSLSPTVAPDGADGTAAALGTSSIVTALGTADHVSYYSGFSPDNPATAWTGQADTTGNFAVFPGVATAAGKVWVSWLSTTSSPSTIGINVQPVQPSLGIRKQAPGSFTGSAYSPAEQGVPLVVRTGTSGPPYTAYVRQDRARVFVWRYGASSPLSLAASNAVYVTLTSAPAGRLWVYWWDNNGWHATRSNKAATRFGPVARIPFPSNMNHMAIGGVGAAGPLEAVALNIPGYDTTKAAIYATQVKPRLTCAASPSSAKPGTKIAITVRDAGDAVSGATVHFAGKTGLTNKYGVVHFTVPSNASGRLTATGSHAGYAGCAATVRVT